MYAHLISVCGYFKKSVLNSGNSQIHQVILCCLPRLNTELCADRTRANPFPFPARCTTSQSFPEYPPASLLCRKIPLHCCSPLSNVPHSTSQSSSTKGRISICFCPHQQRILNGLRRPNTRKPVFPLPAHCTTSQSFPEYPPASLLCRKIPLHCCSPLSSTSS